MYSKSNNYATFFTSNMTNTDKVTYGRVSVPMKTGRKDKDGKAVFEFDSWNARFVGKAREKALALTDRTRITLTEWAAHPGYIKAKNQCYPYLMVMDFEIQKQELPVEQEDSADAFVPLDDDDSQLPF